MCVLVVIPVILILLCCCCCCFAGYGFVTSMSGGSSGQSTTTVYRNAPSPYGTGSYTPPVPYQSVSVTAPNKTAAKEKRDMA